jgi:hypothetical protein
VDQFLFTIVDYGVTETPFLMQLKHEKIEGALHTYKKTISKNKLGMVISSMDL